MSKTIKKAREFARKAHEDAQQFRKYTGEPYIVHPASVAKIVASVTNDEAMICAAWLHDVVEDTPTTISKIRLHFGEDIASLVSDLTDISKPEGGNRETRKQIDLNHTKDTSSRAKTVKLADLIDNLRSITEHDPKFAKVYIEEKKNLLEVLKEGDKNLVHQPCCFDEWKYISKQVRYSDDLILLMRCINAR